MKKYLLFFKKGILFSLIILSGVILFYFFYYNQQYEWNSTELQINWMYTISFFILFFYSISFLIDINFFFKIFLMIIILGTPLWIIIYILELFEFEPIFWNWYTIRELATILCISILSPGLTLSFIKYIKNNSNEDKKRKVSRKYHIHEGFIGIIFMMNALVLWIIRYIMIQHEILKNKLRIYLAIDMILLFLFLFSGSFLIFRDRRDFIKLKFIEKRKKDSYAKVSSIFNPINSESRKFFRSPRLLLYPFGIFLNSVSVSILIHGTDFLPEIVFHINHEVLVLIGVILCFIAGGMIGIDWYRVFAKLYPNLYQEFEQILNDLIE